MTVTDEARLTSKLLTVNDLEGADFTVVKNADGTYDPATRTNTCVDDIADIGFRQDLVPVSTATITFASKTETGASRLESTLESYQDVDSLSAFVDNFLQLARSCTSARGTNDEGVAYDLRVKTEDDPDEPIDGADREVDVEVTGTRTIDDQVVDIAFSYVVVTVDNDLARVAAFDEGDALMAAEAGVTRYGRGIAQEQLRNLADGN
ncbi:MAG: hypothetical protein WB471_09035 [Nocardioides sp.]